MNALSSPASIDARCAELARHAFYCAEQLQLGAAGENTLYGMRIRIPALADRIIALRTAEAAQRLRSQMPEPGYNTDGTREIVTYDGLTREEWIARELGKDDEARDDIEARGERERGEVQL